MLNPPELAPCCNEPGFASEFFEPVLIRVGVGMSEPLEFV